MATIDPCPHGNNFDSCLHCHIPRIQGITREGLIVQQGEEYFIDQNRPFDNSIRKIEITTPDLSKIVREYNEYILCAAIHFDDGKKYRLQPKNIETGLVLCGWRHGCIFPQIGGLVKERKDLGIFEKSQGFITNFNRYVERKEGGEIAFKAGQTSELKETLYSEDLY
jgi:hypothetical protein